MVFDMVSAQLEEEYNCSGGGVEVHQAVLLDDFPVA